MRINNNIIAENAHRQFGITTGNLGRNVERLSSGMRVNRASDDAAGLAISEKMRTQIRGLDRASMNIQDGVSLLQVGDAALQGIHNKIQRMRELTVQAANDTNELLDREMIQMEIAQLTSEINSTVFNTNFNGRAIFDGSVGASFSYHLGRVTYDVNHTTTAGAPFGGVNIPATTVPAAFGRQTATPLAGMEFGGFPPEGLFAMQIVTPANGTLTVVLDFEVQNADGNLTRQQFFDFFTDSFNNLGLGTVINGISYDTANYQVVMDFPHVTGTDPRELTGVMGYPGTVHQQAQIGVSTDALILPGLNGTQNLPFSSSPFLTNRPDLVGTFTPGDSRLIAGQTPVLLGSAGARPAGTDPHTLQITVAGIQTTIPLARGNFTDVASFVEANRSNFANAVPRGFDIDVDPDDPTRITLTTTDVGGRDLTIGPITATPAGTLPALGLGTFSTSSERAPGRSLWIQSGANRGDGIELEIPRLCSRSLGLSIRRPEDEHPDVEHTNSLGAEGFVTTANVESTQLEYSLSVLSHQKATSALSVLTHAVNVVSKERARLGAQQNRLESAKANVDNSSENLQAAESRIRDADVALEMTEFVQKQILMQSGTAMMAHANAVPQGVLQLLGG